MNAVALLLQVRGADRALDLRLGALRAATPVRARPCARPRPSPPSRPARCAFSVTGAGANASGTAESLPCRSDCCCVWLDATAPWSRMLEPPDQDRARERLLERQAQRLELRLVDHRHGVQHHEERHQERDHVGVGEQPALVGMLGRVLLLACHQAACRSSSTASSPPCSPASSGALGRVEERAELLLDDARVVARLDRDDALDQHRARVHLVVRDALQLVADRQEDEVRGRDAVERRDEGARDGGAERARDRRGSRARARGP